MERRSANYSGRAETVTLIRCLSVSFSINNFPSGTQTEMRYISIYLQATRARKRYLITRTKEIILGILPAAALVCGVAACALGLSASGINLVQDPSFEERPPRGLDPHDHPWGVKKRDRPPVSRLCGALPTATSPFLFQRIDVIPNTDYIFSYWIRGTTSLSFGDPNSTTATITRRLRAIQRELTFALTTMATRRSTLDRHRRIMKKSMSRNTIQIRRLQMANGR